ncbi:peptidylprolyl isomerase [uncultured Psychroserpens sp.]|uniref:peptidylprolyl isomerase n=1 Tax=uncultured Psychroserpens sp. TaxID=255436 RepID=UPI00260E06A6|nr:peptidylprolyl isomerase [uncultured Psychroserpens sp.]
MRKILLSTLLCLSLSMVFGQDNFEKSLDSIQTLDDVTIFLKKNKKVKGKVIVFNREKHATRMADVIFKMGVGSKRSFKDAPQKTYYKVIEKYKIPYYRVSYVYLDGSETPLEDINAARKRVISQYNQGATFSDLAVKNSMDDTAKRGGDSGWFKEGDLHPEFEKAIVTSNHAEGDVFTVDIPEIKAYYVVLVTHERKLIEEVKVLKITEPKN